MPHEPNQPDHRSDLGGPKSWAIATLVGAALGVVLAMVFPAQYAPAGAARSQRPAAPIVHQIAPDGTVTELAPDGPADLDAAPGAPHPAEPIIPLVLLVPFAAMLASMSLMPALHARLWTRHFADVALLLGSLMLAYYLSAFGEYGRHAMLHVATEYLSFFALVGGLYVVSGGVHVEIRGPAPRLAPLANTLLLAGGAVLANIVGTTGASVLLIRPFLRMNAGRLSAFHVVMFIFIVSNCGGCLTPIGDPPLYLGYLSGVPFLWTVQRLGPMWLVAIGALLAIFLVVDSLLGRPVGRAPRPPSSGPAISISGGPALVCLVLIVAGVFIDPLLKSLVGITGVPIGTAIQIAVAVAAYRLARPEIHRANGFTFHPVKEVGFLFAGIFLTMAPALAYLAANGSRLGLETPTQFYFASGALSAVLDNAPTYLNFLQTALSVLHLPMSAEGVARFISNAFDVVHADGRTVRIQGTVLLEAVSLGAVFFGAMTYIGNGPNFMVKAIAESAGVRMPSFFGYAALAMVILAPVLLLVWALFIR